MSSGVPLTPEILFEVFQAASSQSQELVQNASSQLKNWETLPGFWGMVQDMFLNRELPMVIRWLAVITLKQGADKYWRKTATNSMSKEEKSYIRSRLIGPLTTEPIPQLAAQNSVIVGKVARLDYPLEWPDLFSDLTNNIREASAGPLDDAATLRLTRSLSMLLHVVKELATGRLIRTKAILQSVTPEVFKVLGGVYMTHVERWHGQLAGGSGGAQGQLDMMHVTLLCLKILRRLVVAGYEFPNRAAEVQELWQILYGQIWALFQAESQLPGTGEKVILLRKHVVSMGKLFLDAASSHPSAFTLFPGTLPLLGKYWEVVVAYGDTLVQRSKAGLNGGVDDSGEEGRRKYREKVALHGMLLFRGCAKAVFNPTATFKYRHKTEKDENREATEIIQTQLFTPQTVTHCMEVLVTKYFILSPSDLEGWNEDPETWSEHWENAVESWEFMIRPCAEKLFMDLMTNYKSVLAEPLMRVFNNSTSSSTDILTKDAIYTAVGLAAPVLHPSLDFDTFLHNTLVNEIQMQQQGSNILRRRIAILIGQWVSVNISEESRTTIYKVTQHLLNRNDPYNDLVVRLTAARCLKSSVNEWEFKVESFLPYVDDLFSKLMGLIDEVDETETRMSLLDVIGIVTERLEHRIAPYAEAIVRILPPLWEQTGEEHLFKQAILTILTKLIAAMKDRSVQYHSIVIPLIKYSVEPGSGMQVYLLEDALELWEATIRSAPAPATPELMELVPLLIPCLELGTLTLRKILDIIESYVLIAPQEMVENFRAPLFASFASLLGTLKPEANSIITNVVEIIIRAASTLGGDQALSIVGQELHSSGFLPSVLTGIHGSYSAHQTTGPNRTYSPLNTIVLTDYFGVLSRMVLASTGWFVENMRVFGESKGMGVDEVMKWLLDEWFEHFSNIGHPKTRKLNTIALTKLLETNEGWVLGRLQDLMVVWTDLINEQLDSEGGDALIYWVQPEDDENAPVTPESSRRKALTQSDPVHAVNVIEFTKHHLEKVQSENGGPDRFREEWVANVDKYVLEGFVKLGVI